MQAYIYESIPVSVPAPEIFFSKFQNELHALPFVTILGQKPQTFMVVIVGAFYYPYVCI